MTDHVLQAESIELNISPELFHLYATQYYDCKQAFDIADFSPVPYVLLCRAIELELKSRHLVSMTTEQVKTKFGHNLIKSFDALPTVPVVLTSEERKALESASNIFNVPNKGFEYVKVTDAATGFKSFPDLAVLDNIARKLLNKV